MRFNLLEERWIPVVREDGSRDTIAPWEVGGGNPPPVDLLPPRPDFRATLLEFLIGLLQTAFAPAKINDWRRLLQEPPDADTLRKALAPHAPYFNLFGDRPLFMQDLELAPPKKDKDFNGIAALIIDAPAPGGQTERHNADHFVKRGGITTLCPACAAMALYTLQAFAPSGGAGHRTSLRGGGPLSTLVDGPTLWEKLWLNVLPLSSTSARNAAAPKPAGLPGSVYPWAAPTRLSPKGEQTHPSDVHVLQAYWGMPRRIVLCGETPQAGTTCSLCGAESPLMVSRYCTKPHGTNYGDTWRHPLTPYREQGQNKPTLAVKGTASIAGYGHWLGIVYGQRAGNGVRRAACVDSTLSLLGTEADRARQGRNVTVAGYDMDNMKPLQWCESRFPSYPVDQDRLPDFRSAVDTMVEAADAARKNLLGLLKEALVNEAGRNQAKIDKTLFATTADTFWGRTEQDFYRLARDMAQAPDHAASEPARIQWGDILVNAARDLFEETTERGRTKPERMQRIVEAGRKLNNFNRKKMRSILDLPETGGKQ